MTDTAKKPAFEKTVILTGQVKFNNINEAKSFKLKDGTETKPKFDLVLTFDSDSPNVALLEGLHKEGVDFEMAQIPKAKQRTVAPKPVKIEEDVGKDGIETGLLKVTLTRAERMGKPELRDSQNTPISRTFIRSGSDVKVQATIVSYNVAGNVGTSLRLEGIQIIKETEGTGDYTPKPPELMFEALSTENPFM